MKDVGDEEDVFLEYDRIEDIVLDCLFEVLKRVQMRQSWFHAYRLGVGRGTCVELIRAL